MDRIAIWKRLLSVGALLSVAFVLAMGCDSNNSGTSTSSNHLSNGNSSSCTVTNNTSSAGSTNNGCTLLNRTVSGCQSSRTGQGLSGAWLKFSCNVTETAVTISGVPYVQLVTQNFPDYTSNYWPTTSACYVAYATSYPDPNTIAAQGVTMDIPVNPGTSGSSMALGGVGMAIDGVLIYDNQAAPGDNIFDELGSFDECQGHPDNSSKYHYHTEPYAISYDDDNLIGVMRDGYFLYGRLDPGSTSVPTNLDSDGGHTSVTVDSPSTAVYHYHANLQSGTNTAGSSVSGWFLTKGTYRGTAGSCNGC